MKRVPIRRRTPLKSSAQVEVICAVCGETFSTYRSEASRRRTCSISCAAALKRSRGGTHCTGSNNPNYRGGTRTGVRDRAGETRWRQALGPRCMAPGCTTPYGERQPLFLHHICYRQHVRNAGGDVWDPRNALTICNSCHSRHHKRAQTLPLTCLPDAAFEFAFELLGSAAEVYLRRYYSGEDNRLGTLGEAA